MKRLKLQEIYPAMFDKRLYGLSTFFWLSGPPLALGFVTQVLIYIVLNQLMLFVYIPVFFMLILFSGLGSKNFAQEVNNMGRFRGFLFILASVLASVVPFTSTQPSDPLQASIQFSLLFTISALALTMAVVEVAIWGQRVSLRNHVHLTTDFFKKQKTTWKKKLVGFPNSENIISGINDGRFVVTLFDRGSFSLVVLWSCNVMEQIIDAAADGVISVDPKMDEFFKTDRGGSQNYPRQLKNLGYEFSDEDKTLGVETLWNILRNKVAHHNYRPTFNETYGALRILISFMDTMPTILQAWKNP